MINEIPHTRSLLQTFHHELERRFHEGEAVDSLLKARSQFIDQLLIGCWRHFLAGANNHSALIAVGGYGRQELHPHSDIDLLVLINEPVSSQLKQALSELFTYLWDIGLKPGHSVRSVSGCIEEANKDQTVLTNLMDARLLGGDDALFCAMKQGITPDRIWPSLAFYQAKLKEQADRYAKYHDTAYNLEPNIKEGPGGMRDIQTIAWVIKRHFNTDTLHELVGRGYLTESEYQEFRQSQTHLWRIRFALHTVTGRCEDRLLFDFQRTLAEWFGYEGEGNAPVEAFMQTFYRTALSVQRLNEILLQQLGETLSPDFEKQPVPLDKHFQAVNQYIEVRHPKVFQSYPLGLLEIYLHLQRNPELKGIRAHTIRAIRQHLPLIDEAFRKDPRACELFLEMLRRSEGVTHQFRRMNRDGILAAYLPEFAHIVGRMQYDLFHTYTVDEHTLFVVRNLRRMAIAEFHHELPLCSDIFPLIPKPELLYIAGLYHDIGKGREGDHSKVGEVLARHFCERHNLPPHDTQLVCWLVKNHLLMSITAQRKDISDPEVIQEFARTVGNENRLNHLYLLTVADIRGTNPSLWNSWRDSLLRELYMATRRVLRLEEEAPLSKEEEVIQIQQAARSLLHTMGLPDSAIDRVWQYFSNSYFLRCLPEECAWQTLAIAEATEDDLPLILTLPQTRRGSAEILVYMKDRPLIFSQTVALLDQLGLTILAAQLETTTDGYVIDRFSVLESDGRPISELSREQQIGYRLKRCLKEPREPCFRIERRPSRQLQHFSIPVEIRFPPDPKNAHTILELITTDRPGLLSKIGAVFDYFGLRVHEARIATLGSRAEDVFYLDKDKRPLTSEALKQALRDKLLEAIES